MNEESNLLISGDALKAAARKYIQIQAQNGQSELPGIFDKWFLRVVTRLSSFDPNKSWEESVNNETTLMPRQQEQALAWDFMRLKLFLDRWQQGRYVSYAQRKQSGTYYHPKYGTEFGSDVLLTCQGAPSFLEWKERPLMKTVFDFALYPQIIAELKPRTIFEIGSGSGASAMWMADHLALQGIEGHVHSVDITLVQETYKDVTFSQGDCALPAKLFDAELLNSSLHPWLVIEDAHHNVAAVADYFDHFLKPGDYLVIEDSEIKQNDILCFLEKHPRHYLVDTKYTDFFGRNATCALDSIFVRMDS